MFILFLSKATEQATVESQGCLVVWSKKWELSDFIFKALGRFLNVPK